MVLRDFPKIIVHCTAIYVPCVPTPQPSVGTSAGRCFIPIGSIGEKGELPACFVSFPIPIPYTLLGGQVVPYCFDVLRG